MACDEGASCEIEDQAAVHLLVKVKIEIIKCFLMIAKCSLFYSSLEQSLAATSEFVRDQAGEEVDRRYGFGLRLMETSFEHGRNTAQP